MDNEGREIAQIIKNHIAKCGGAYNAWYVGIAQDPKARLFNDHSVDQKNDAWIYRTALGEKVARDVEEYFINTLGTDGDTGGGDENTKSVYAYKKNSHTNP